MVERPKSITGATTKIMTGCGPLFVTVNEGPTEIEGQVYREIKLQMGKSGGCQSCFMDGMSGALTLAWNAAKSRKALIKILRGIQCPNPTVSGGVRTLSCLDAVAVVLLAKDRPLETVPTWETPEEKNILNVVPEEGEAA